MKCPSKNQSSGRDGRLGAQVAAPPRAAARIEVGDLVEEEHLPRLDARRAHVRARALEAGAEAVGGAALGEARAPRAAENARLVQATAGGSSGAR